MIQHIMFDFDGTIADTSEGIIRSMHYAYDKLGIARVSDDTIRQIIGPPLEEMFATLLSLDDTAYIRQAVLYFRERYAVEGIREMCIYPGVKEALEQLTRAGKKLYIVTSKPETFVRDICKKEQIDYFFAEITGVATDGSSRSKKERMQSLMEQFHISSENGIMVGDRAEDANSAAANYVKCVGVTYGFGKKEDLQSSGCVKIINKIEDLADVIDSI